MNPPNALEPLLTFSQAADFLSVSLRQIRRLIDSGKIPVVKISVRVLRLRLCDLQSYLASVTVQYAKP